MRIHAALGLLLSLTALCICACGADGPTASGHRSQDPSQKISKTELISQGDAICSKTDSDQRSALKAYEEENPIKPNDQAAIEKALMVVAFPPIAAEIEDLEALGLPAGDEADLEAIFVGLWTALQDAEKDPSTVMASGEGPFTKPDRLAAAYGFKACARAL